MTAPWFYRPKQAHFGNDSLKANFGNDLFKSRQKEFEAITGGYCDKDMFIEYMQHSHKRLKPLLDLFNEEFRVKYDISDNAFKERYPAVPSSFKDFAPFLEMLSSLMAHFDGAALMELLWVGEEADFDGLEQNLESTIVLVRAVMHGDFHRIPATLCDNGIAYSASGGALEKMLADYCASDRNGLAWVKIFPTSIAHLLFGTVRLAERTASGTFLKDIIESLMSYDEPTEDMIEEVRAIPMEVFPFAKVGCIGWKKKEMYEMVKKRYEILKSELEWVNASSADSATDSAADSAGSSKHPIQHNLSSIIASLRAEYTGIDAYYNFEYVKYHRPATFHDYAFGKSYEIFEPPTNPSTSSQSLDVAVPFLNRFMQNALDIDAVNSLYKNLPSIVLPVLIRHHQIISTNADTTTTATPSSLEICSALTKLMGSETFVADFLPEFSRQCARDKKGCTYRARDCICCGCYSQCSS
jgi:hypothetical protein